MVESPTRVLSKARTVLDCFLPNNAPFTLTEVHVATGIPMTTAQRLLRSLVAEGFLVHDGNRYRLGLSLVGWAAAARRGLNVVTVAIPAMERLRDSTEETATLLVREGLQRICVAASHSRHSLAQHVPLGDVLPLQAGSPSKVLLAHEPDVARRVVERGLVAFTDYTVVDPDLYLKELEQVRLQGYATSTQENADWVASVSSPIFDYLGSAVAALCLGGPSLRVTPDWLNAHAPVVMEAADEISRAMGWHDDSISQGSNR